MYRCFFKSLLDFILSFETQPKTKDYYGDSKLKAELGLLEMNDSLFKVAILRPPMIFGEGCKGNFPRLVSLAMKMPVFPKITNKRSMLHIDNLCAIVEFVIQDCSEGMFFPQNSDYFSTTELAVKIAERKGKKLKTTRALNWGVWMAYPFMSQLKKLFGNLTYDKSISNHFDNRYVVTNNEESIIKSVGQDNNE